ncbi:YCF48-related protein [Pseudomonas sp.]|uniref:WD40/YVTN/BNR-like repeat-containing protein n=1 Tax=Pseudomonas sp. TaxID=306 RepID=UPI0031B62C89
MRIQFHFAALLVALLPSLYTPAAVFAAGSAAPLDRPALQSRLADQSALLDVVNVHGRLVAVGERGHILLSGDDGNSWAQAPVPVSVTLTAVNFSDAQNGWVVGHGGVVLKTQDGGVQWTRQLDGRSLTGALAQALLTAQNAGDERLARKLQRLIDEGPDKPLLDVRFLDPLRGFAAGAYGLLLATDDGGLHWRVACDLLESGEDRHLYAIRRLGNRLFLVGEQGLLYRSSDNGHSFAPLPSPAEGSWFDLLGEGDELLLLGLRGALWRSEDGGVHWSQLRVDTQYSFVTGAALADGKGYLLADDGGGIWQLPAGAEEAHRLDSSARFPLTGLTFAADGEAVASGLLGTLRFAAPRL